MSHHITSLQIQGPIVVLPLEEYLDLKTQVEAYQRLKTVYDREREIRFQRLFSLAERNRDIPLEQAETEIAAAIVAIRSE